MDQDRLKQQVAEAAIERVASHPDDQLVLGIGTGSTAEWFIKGLERIRHRIDVTVSSSERSATLLRDLGFTVSDLNAVPRVDLYVDGADEANERLQLVKGGGAALTRWTWASSRIWRRTQRRVKIPEAGHFGAPRSSASCEHK